jgi:8-oxo-dGTP pyrophosphatase MutT (NUDIX family)
LDIATRLTQIRSAVHGADHLLDDTTYPPVRDLFDACRTNPRQVAALQQRAPEYGREEYLLLVNHTGVVVHPPQTVVDQYRAHAARYPGFGRWFQETPLGSKGRPVLLVARWLCHLAGFRHRAVQLFLDHPAAAPYTLLQVRSMTKVQFPGCFDMPAAGHIAGIAPPGDTLFKELEEELGLTLADVAHIRPIGSYDCIEPPRRSELYDAEYRAVFCGRLQPGALARIRFVDGEVAAMAVFSTAEIQMLLHSHPERIASGLARSWPLYLAAKDCGSTP